MSNGPQELPLCRSQSLDGFAALACAWSLGMGVAFSAPAVLLYQGSITLAAAWVPAILTPAMVAEMMGDGGQAWQWRRKSR